MQSSIQYAFNLEQIADRVYSKHKQQLKRIDQQHSKLSISKLLSASNKSIIHLFGFHLAQRIPQGNSFVKAGKMRSRPWVLYDEFEKYVKIFWPDLDKYQRVLPVLFAILKDRGAVYLKQLDQFVQISRKDINPFVAHIKQSMSNIKIQQLIETIQRVAERQDIMQTGHIQKILLDELIKSKFVHQSQINPFLKWPVRLLAGQSESKIDYRLLLSDKYLSAGKSIDQFLYGHLVRKIVKCIRNVGEIKKTVGKKKIKKPTTRKIIAPTKTQKLINQFIQANKVKTVEDPHQLNLTAKFIITDLLYLAVQISQNQRKSAYGNKIASKSIRKSLYITQPQLPQLQYQTQQRGNKQASSIDAIKFTENSNISIVVPNNNSKSNFSQENYGQIIDVLNCKIGDKFQIKPSKLLKTSDIVAYQIFDDVIYLLQQNGLLYSWRVNQNHYTNQIETSLTSRRPMIINKSSTYQEKYLAIEDGILSVNCTHCHNGLIQFYQLSTLQYIGSITLNSASFSIPSQLLQQAQLLRDLVENKIAVDRKINSYQEYRKIVLEQFQCKFISGDSNPRLYIGQMISKYYSQKYFTINEIKPLIKLILQTKARIKIPFPEPIRKMLENCSSSNNKSKLMLNPEQLQYLQKYGYISNSDQSQIHLFQQKYNEYIYTTKEQNILDRKKNILTLFEDCNLAELSMQSITLNEFKGWIAPACLMNKQLADIIEHVLDFKPNGKIDMSKLTRNQHYNRIVDNRKQTYQIQNYRKQYLVPVIIQNYYHCTARQKIIMTTSFPLQKNIYVASMVTGKLLKTINLSHFTNIHISLELCQKNGCYAVGAGRTVQIWSKQGLFNDQNDLIKNNKCKQLINLQQQDIHSAKVIYESNTLLTLTKNSLKIWDLSEMFSVSDETRIFRLKPGYKAIQKQIKSTTCSVNYKKRIYYRGSPKSIYHFRTRNSQIVCGILSVEHANSTKSYIKSFYLNKFHILLDQKKQHEQIPLKLTKQFQQIALKRRRMHPEKKITSTTDLGKQQQFTDSEKYLIDLIINQFKKNLKATTAKNIASKGDRVGLTKKINRLTNNLCLLYNKNMFINAEKDGKQKSRMTKIFQLLTVSNKQEVKQILNPQFLSLYTTSSPLEKNNFNLSKIFKDSRTISQLKQTVRVLYFLSLIEKYSRPYLYQCQFNPQVKLIKLISIDRQKMSEELVMALLPIESLMINKNIAKKCIKALNQLENTIEICIKIIKGFIPTRFRFLSPRYLKQIVADNTSPELSQFLHNRYQNHPETPQQLRQHSQNILHPPQLRDANIFEYIEDKNLLNFILSQIEPNFPAIKYCNYTLIQSMQAYNLITEREAIYYTIKESEQPSQRLSAFSNMPNNHHINYDEICSKILKHLQSSSIDIQKLPYPIITLSYFKDKIYDQQYELQIFYDFLKGSRAKQTMLTQNLLTCLSMTKMGLSLKYSLKKWEYIFNSCNNTTRNYSLFLKSQIQLLVEKVPKSQRIMSASNFKGVLMSFIQKQEYYQELVLRAAYASTASRQKLEEWDKRNKEMHNINISYQGMHVNVNQLLKYLHSYNPYSISPIQSIVVQPILSSLLPIAIQGQQIDKIQVPSFYIYKILSDSTNNGNNSKLLSINRFRKILNYNINNRITLKNIENVVKQIFPFGTQFTQIDQVLIHNNKQLNQHNYDNQNKHKYLIQFKANAFGEILINKYHRLNFQYKFTIVDQNVPTTQVIQLIGSRLITLHLFSKNRFDGELPQFLPVKSVLETLSKQCLKPAVNSYIRILLSKTPMEIISLVQYQLERMKSKNQMSQQNMVAPITGIYQYFSNTNSGDNQQEKGLLICILKYLSQQSDSAMSINIQILMKNIQLEEDHNKISANYKNYVQLVHEKLLKDNKINLVQMFMRYAINNHHPFCLQNKTEQYVITHQHYQHILAVNNNDKQCWYINYSPTANIGEFINHIRKIEVVYSSLHQTNNFNQKMNKSEQLRTNKSYQNILQFFSDTCIGKFGIEGLLQKIGTKPIFAEFYFRCKTIIGAKNIIKYSTEHYLMLYKQLLDLSTQAYGNQQVQFTTNRLYINEYGLFRICQQKIPVAKKVEWIAAIYDRQLIEEPLDNEEFYLETEYKLQKLKLLYTTPQFQNTKQQQHEIYIKQQVQKLKKSLNYHLYLINKYLGDDLGKLQQIYKGIQDHDIEGIYRLLLSYGVNNDIHSKQIQQYIEHHFIELKKQIPISQQQLQAKQIRKVVQYLRKTSQNISGNINYQIHLDPTQTPASIIPILAKYNQQGKYSKYYCTYHTVIQYCQQQLLRKYYRQQKCYQFIRDQLYLMATKHNIGVNQLYKILGNGNYQIMCELIPECINSTDQQSYTKEEAKIIVKQLFIKNKNSNNQYRTMISILEFTQVIFPSEDNKGNQDNQILYSKLDILGIGYANLNEVEQFMGQYSKETGPYVNISDYLEENYSSHRTKINQLPKLPTQYLLTYKNTPHYIQPPQNLQTVQKIKQKLLKFQMPFSNSKDRNKNIDGIDNRKYNIINKQLILAVMGEFGYSDNPKFIKFINNNYLLINYQKVNLAGIINWLTQYQGQEDTVNNMLSSLVSMSENENNKDNKVSNIVKAVQDAGGVYYYLKEKINNFHSLQDTINFIQNLLEINKYCKDKDIDLINENDQNDGLMKTIMFSITNQITANIDTSKCIYLLGGLLEFILNYQYKQNRHWSTQNQNKFYKIVNNLPQSAYSLVHKFYQKHSNKHEQEQSMHKLYDKISINKQLTFFTLWQYIQDKGIIGYSRNEVAQLFQAVDYNSDRTIQSQQFCEYWMACQQIFLSCTSTNTGSSNGELPITKMQRQIKEQFIELCIMDLDKVNTEQMTLQVLQKLANINNVDKIDRLIRAVRVQYQYQITNTQNIKYQQQDVGSGAFDINLQLNRSKIKILADRLKSIKISKSLDGDTQKSNNNSSPNNIILMGIKKEIYPYMNNLHTSENISRFITAKYPKLGRRIIQQLSQVTQMKKQKVTKYYEMLKQQSTEQSTKNSSSKPRQNNNKDDRVQILEDKLIKPIQAYDRKHTLKTTSYQILQNGESVARSLIDQQVNIVASRNYQQTQQISNYLGKQKVVPIQIAYKNQQEQPQQNIQALSILADSYLENKQQSYIKMIGKNPALLAAQELRQDFNLFSIIRVVSNNGMFFMRKIVWNDTDYVCKSEAKVNLLKMKQLYNNSKISLVPMYTSNKSGVSLQASSRFKIIGFGSLDYQKCYIPLITKYPLQLHIPQNLASTTQNKNNQAHLLQLYLDNIMQLLNAVVEQLYYIYRKYQMTCLLIRTDNLLISSEDNRLVKFDNFITGIQLDLTQVSSGNTTRQISERGSSSTLGLTKIKRDKGRNYVDGIDSKVFIDKNSTFYPPEIDQGIYSEAIDVYQLVHIIHKLFAIFLIPKYNDSSQINPNPRTQKLQSISQQCQWSHHSELHQISSQMISSTKLSDKQKLYWSLMYQCSHYEWYMRPKLYQMKQLITNYLNTFMINIGANNNNNSNHKQSGKYGTNGNYIVQNISEFQEEEQQHKYQQEQQQNKEAINTNKLIIFQQLSTNQQILASLQQGIDYQSISLLLQKNSKGKWSLEQLIQFRILLQSYNTKTISQIYKYYNNALLQYLQQEYHQFSNNQQLSDPQICNAFLSNIIEYLITFNITSNEGNKQQQLSLLKMAISVYKNVLTHQKINGYLQWCDTNWQIEQFIISSKIQKVNMKDKLNKLHNNSLYYHDIATLMECRIALSVNNTNTNSNTNSNSNNSKQKCSTNQKVAISFIYSSIISNNINKVYAVYKSRVLQYLYCYLNSSEQIQQLVLNIYQKCTDTLNPSKHINRFKAVNQVYKIMMVIYNTLHGDTETNNNNKQQSMRKSISPIKKSTIHKNNSNIKNSSSIFAQDRNYSDIPISPIRTILYSHSKMVNHNNADLNKSIMILNSNQSFNINPNTNTNTNSNMRNSKNKNSTKGSSVISMLDFMNNYYTLGGQQCKQSIMVQICEEQLCTLPALVHLLHIDVRTATDNVIQKLDCIVQNMGFHQKMQHLIRSPILSASPYYHSNKTKYRKNEIIAQSHCIHQKNTSLCELATDKQYKKQNIREIIIQNIKFYNWYQYYTHKKTEDIRHQLAYSHKTNTHAYFLAFMSKMQKICEKQLPSAQKDYDPKSLQIVISVIHMYRVLFKHWTEPPVHVDYIAATFRFLMRTLQQIYEYEQIYLKNKVHENVVPDILYVFNMLWTEHQTMGEDSTPLKMGHDLIRIAIDNGYIHFYCRIVKKQHSLLIKFIDKNVENIHLITNYPPEAQFRLINFYNLLNFKIKDKKQKEREYKTEIQQLLISTKFIEYIFGKMLKSNIYMDLRFFKSSNPDIIPYRYCNPLKSEAIAMIGFVINSNVNQTQQIYQQKEELALRDEFVGRIIPQLLEEAKVLANWRDYINNSNKNSSRDQNMDKSIRVIETFWLLANISGCQGQRLRYQIINLQINDLIKQLIANYSMLAEFFPNLMQTVYQ